jgi:hypothetical protein
MKWLAYILFDLLVVGLLIAVTQPIDLRAHRWRRIGLSLPWVTFLGQILIDRGLPGGWTGGVATMMWLSVNIGILGLIWGGPLAGLAAHGVVRLLDPPFQEARLTRPDFSAARRHRQEGELKEAVEAARKELKKDAVNYEGLILLAQLYQDLNLPEEALKQLDIILGNPQATDDQKEAARVEKEACTGLAQYNQIMEMNRKQRS